MLWQVLIRYAASASLLAAAASGGEPSGFSGSLQLPELGYVWDSNRQSLRPLHGIPGASVTGEPVELQCSSCLVAVSPRHDFVLMASGASSDGNPSIWLAGAPQFVGRKLESAIGMPRRILLSPSGSSAAFDDGDAIAVMAGLPAKPVLRSRIAVSLAGHPLAISDDGSLILTRSAEGDLRFVDASGQVHLLSAIKDVSIAAFAPASHKAAILSSGLLAYLPDPQQPESVRWWGEESGILSPLGIAFAADGHSLIAAHKDGQITQVEIASSQSQSVSCRCAVTGIDRMLGGEVFRLNEISSAAINIVVAQVSGEPGSLQTFFVPPAVEGEKSNQ